MDPLCIAKRVKHRSFTSRIVAIRIVNTIIQSTPRFRKKALSEAVVSAVLMHPDDDVRLAGIGLLLVYRNPRAKVLPHPCPP
jgi:hypothetical protein